jgi:hypothetical protein
MHEAQMREEARQRELEQQAASAARPEPEQPQPRPEPVDAEPAPRPQPQPQPQPARIDPREVLESAGLQMVETRPDRVPAVPPEPEPVVLGRPRRERARGAEAADEPLVQVETKN